MTKRLAFTLIELLVVIAIIAILAAILFPVFAKARDRANTTACLNNMKQLGVGLYTYLQDYDESYPILRRVIGGSTAWTWRESLFPYVKSLDVAKCPSNVIGKKFPALKAEGNTYPVSYALNGSLFGSLAGDITVFRVVKMRNVKEPSNSIFVVEARHPSAELGPWLVSLPYNPGGVWDPGANKGYFNSHSGRINFVMCDTSARSMKLAQTCWPDMWHDSRMTDAQMQSAAQSVYAEYR